MASTENILASDCLPASDHSCQVRENLVGSLQGIRADFHATQPAHIEAEIVNLFLLYRTPLYRYAAAVASDKEMIQDAIQEAFLRYFKARTAGQGVENPRAWLFRVLRNYILDRHRETHSRAAVELEAAGDLADSRQDVETGYVQREMFRRALSVLSPREMECMRLRVEGLDYDEISQVLQIRPGTVGALLTRGLKKIRKTGLMQGEA
ncbi:MAG TPA: sigma-70 family RNA polymerase sigma factor [Acidobacteriota bacterium]|nr:sigma-70 family RNA polymerase sigma factor [Acidobacteriota bacterium]